MSEHGGAPLPGPRPQATPNEPASLDASALLRPLEDLDELASADHPERFTQVLEALTAALDEGAR
ncbi:MAG: hypothetical protein LBE25_00815 [Arthrobacter sp.]|jgi:hypothetical protein|nr:hypothetical protein [Arthrobacter sp.]